MTTKNSEQCSIDELNKMDQPTFVSAFGQIFEHSQWIAERTWLHLPFNDIDDLYEIMITIVKEADRDRQLALIHAHSELADITSKRLTVSSKNEQSKAGLDYCNPAQLQKNCDFNEAYTKEFGFPFILAVSELDVDTIIERFTQRMKNNLYEEFQLALNEIFKLTRQRLQDCLH